MAQSVDKPSKLCFVIGPIGAENSDVRVHADWLLEEVIEPVMKDFPEFNVKRADRDPRPGLIDAQLIVDLHEADIVIADLSNLNPNVFYEIGIRHMTEKPIVHMQLADEEPPFDLKLYRAIKFRLRQPNDLRKARTELSGMMKAILSPDYTVQNPVTQARGQIKLAQHATPAEQVLLRRLETIEEIVGRLDRNAKGETYAITPSNRRLVRKSSLEEYALRRPDFTVKIDDPSSEKAKEMVERIRQAAGAVGAIIDVHLVGPGIFEVQLPFQTGQLREHLARQLLAHNPTVTVEY